MSKLSNILEWAVLKILNIPSVPLIVSCTMICILFTTCGEHLFLCITASAIITILLLKYTFDEDIAIVSSIVNLLADSLRYFKRY